MLGEALRKQRLKVKMTQEEFGVCCAYFSQLRQRVGEQSKIAYTGDTVSDLQSAGHSCLQVDRTSREKTLENKP